MQERKEQARVRLERHGQGHVLRFWNELDDHGRRRLLDEVEALDLPWLDRVLAHQPEPVDLAEVTPCADVVWLSDAVGDEAVRAGGEALTAGRYGVLVVAGGLGSRLGFDGPKGAYPVGSVSGKTLFQLHAERLLACGHRWGVVPPLYLMTSRDNHEQTIEIFKENEYFGLDPARVMLFEQGLAPAVDRAGKLLMADRDRLVLAPNGNGGLYAALRHSGALDHMDRLGVDTLGYAHVDNPLVPSCDARFVGFHLLRSSDYSVKAMHKNALHDKVGHFALRGGKLCVLEYFELSSELIEATDDRGQPLYGLCNPGQFIWTTAFVRAQADRTDLPFHHAHKKIAHIDAQGRPVKPAEPNGIKLEAFAMDTLPDAGRTLLVECRRDEEFAPLKNPRGADSPHSAAELMTRLYSGWIIAAGGRIVDPGANVEVSPLFAEDASELAARLPGGVDVARDLYLDQPIENEAR